LGVGHTWVLQIVAPPDVTGQSGSRMASEPLVPLKPALLHETVLPQAIHMVERPDVWHAIVDVAVWRVGRHRRAGQSLLPHPGRQDRSDAAFLAALGDLQRLCRCVPYSAVMARLDASYR